MSKGRLADRLDWNDMLGFEQIVDNRADIRSMADDHRMGAKVGPKPTGQASVIGSKVGEKTGTKPEIRLGAKTGEKPNIRLGAKTGIKPNDILRSTGH